MRFGLEENIIEKLNEVFETNPNVDKAIVFGSRAKGNFKKNSDIDIAVKGPYVNFDDVLALMGKLDTLSLPYKIDLINYHTINEPALVEHIIRVGIELYSRWKECKLGDVTEYVNRGVSPTYVEDDGVPILNQKCIRNGRINFSLARHTSKNKKYTLEKRLVINDLLINSTGVGTAGRVSRFLRNDLCYVDSHVSIVRVNDTIAYPAFVFFNLNSREDEIESYAEGSTGQIELGRTRIKDIEISLPPLSEQMAIASILSSLDDKIDLLHRQNKTLEQLAETLFRQWFVEEAEESWEKGKVEDEFEFTMGQSPKGSSLNENKEGMIFYQGRTDFAFRFPEPRIYTNTPKRLAKKFDTLVSVRAPVGDMNMAIEECCLGRGVAAFRYKKNNSFYSYTYYKMRSLMIQIKQFEDNGSVFGSIGKDDFKKLKNILPPKELIDKFQNEVRVIDEKIYSNSIQIITLTKLRDSLLPKLMSGEVRVNLN